MKNVQYLEFPSDDAILRLNFCRDIFPEVESILGELKLAYRIERSSSAHEDREFMVAIEKSVELFYIEAIQKKFPDDGIRSEESGAITGKNEFEWFLDPVDGTRNFIHGNPMYCTAAGVCFRGEPVVGIVFAPELKEQFSAIKGMSSEKNLEAIQVSDISLLHRALIASGLPYRRKELLNSIMANFSAFVASGAGLRRSGSTILDLCWISMGRLDATWERSVSRFDLCATSVILEEAGGILSDFSGKKIDFTLDNSTDIIASNGLLHECLSETLLKAREAEGLN